MKHRKPAGGGDEGKVSTAGGAGGEEEVKDDTAEVVEPEQSQTIVSKKKKEKKEMTGLGTAMVNLQLPIYGLAVRQIDDLLANAAHKEDDKDAKEHKEDEDEEDEDKKKKKKEKEKGKKKEKKSAAGGSAAASGLAVVVGGGGGAGNTGIDNKLALFHFREGGLHLITEADMGECAVMNLALHPQERVVACGAENRCRIVSISKDKFTANQEFQTDFNADEEDSDQKAVLFSPDGKTLLTAGVDGAVRLWDWPSLKERAILKPSAPKEIASMHISPDGKLLAVVTGQAGYVCRVWKLSDHSELQSLGTPGGDKGLGFRDCKFSPDGNYLYTIQTKGRSDSYLSKWSTRNWKEITTVVSHTRAAGACVSLNVSQDGKYIATGSGEGEVAIFRTSDMKWIKKKRVHDFFVSKVAFAPDSSQLFSTSGDHSLAVTSVENARGIISMYRRELFITIAVIVALLAVLLQFVQSVQ